MTHPTTIPPRDRRRKKAPKIPSPLEHVEQSLLFQWADLFSTRYPELRWLYAIPNFSGRLGNLPPVAAIRQAQKLNAEGRKKGYPDVGLDVARGGYHGLRIEMKRADATPSDVSIEQREWHTWLAQQGYCVEVCNGWQQAAKAILAYLNGGCAPLHLEDHKP